MKIRPPDIRNSQQTGIEHRAKPIRTMTRTKTESRIEPEETTFRSEALKFPPDGLFTGRAIAEELGVGEDTIRKTYYPKACEIYQTCLDRLKSGNFYTQTAAEEFLRMRQNCHTTRLIFNANGAIVRNADGTPAIEPNPQKMSKRQYCNWRWSENPELKEALKANSVEEAIESGGLATIPDTYDVEVMGEFDDAIEATEELGEGMQAFIAMIQTSARQTASASAAIYSQTFVQQFGKEMQTFQQSMGKSLQTKR
jgi:hypothetical protein